MIENLYFATVALSAKKAVLTSTLSAFAFANVISPTNLAEDPIYNAVEKDHKSVSVQLDKATQEFEQAQKDLHLNAQGPAPQPQQTITAQPPAPVAPPPPPPAPKPAPVVAVPVGHVTTPSENKAILREIVGSEGDAQYQCAYEVIRRESGFNTLARNPSSGAGGLPQALPATKLASAGSDWRTNGRTQLLWFKNYVKGRYGTYCNALAHHNRVNWY